MPVFHTRTIDSILEPVAQQVSELIILHEEAEAGGPMPDLIDLVANVKKAVDGLIQVGNDMIMRSDDEIFRHDMPSALHRLDDASFALLESSQLLGADSQSFEGRKKLAEGCRGILQGVSSVLLTFDESEVRKIIRVCKGVLEYLAVTEVIDTMEDLLEFIRNLTPIMTKMSKDVEARVVDLTHQAHCDLLRRCLENLRLYTPTLISSMKTIVSTRNPTSNEFLPEALATRAFIVQHMSDEITEIVRVLQLTTWEEDEWGMDELQLMRKAQTSLASKLKQARDWLADANAAIGTVGDRSLRQVLEEAAKVADRCVDKNDRAGLTKCISDIDSMAAALAELKQQRKGASPQGMSLAKSLQDKLAELQERVKAAVYNSEQSGVRRPGQTLEAKFEQAAQWLLQPARDDHGLGEEASRLILMEARKAASALPPQKRSNMLQLADHADSQLRQMCELCQRGQASDPAAAALSQDLLRKLYRLKKGIQLAIVSQIADDFVDLTTPLKLLTDAATAPLNQRDRENVFNMRGHEFNDHSDRLVRTARMVAMSGGCRDRDLAKLVFGEAGELEALAPQLVNAAAVVLYDPSNPHSLEHFGAVKQQWLTLAETVRLHIDRATDTLSLIEATEQGMLVDTQNTEAAITQADSTGIVNSTSNFVRRANRVLVAANQEAENWEDPAIQSRLGEASQQLKSRIPAMVAEAKSVTINPRDGAAVGRWRVANDNVMGSVGNIKQLMQPLYPRRTDDDDLDVSTIPRAPPLVSPRGRPTLSQDVLDGVQRISIHDQVAGGSMAGRGRDRLYNRSDSSSLRSPTPNYLSPGSSVVAPATPGTPSIGRSPHRSRAPPRPPLPSGDWYYGAPPPRPPPPASVGNATDTEDDEESLFTPGIMYSQQVNEPIMQAAYSLHKDISQWSSRDNELIAASKRMVLLMTKLSTLVRVGGSSKRELIDVAKEIAAASDDVTHLSKKLASECTDKRIRAMLLQACERIPTIGTQLKILSTVKASMLGAQELDRLYAEMGPPAPYGRPAFSGQMDDGSDEDREATEMIVINAQNLMQSVKETVEVAEAASIKIRVESGYTIRWVRKRPWYY